MARLRKRKNPEQRLKKSLLIHQDFLVARLKNEWNQIQKAARREEIIAHSKMIGATVGRTVLALLVVGGVLTLAALTPNIFTLFGPLARRRGFFERTSLYASVRYLRKKKFIKRGSKQRDTITLTNRGFRHAISDAFRNLKINRPEQWDGVWRMVVFDVPEKDKWARDNFARKLRELGFHRMQESVYILPYPCREELNFLSDIFSISKYVKTVETRTVENEDDIREIFALV